MVDQFRMRWAGVQNTMYKQYDELMLVCDAGPTSDQHRLNVSCSVGENTKR